MKWEKIYALFFSATGTTEKTVRVIARRLAEQMNLPLEEICFTDLAAREQGISFTEDSIVVVGSPTYAGKLPNKILPDFQEKLKGNGALAVPVVLFGNRSFDNALAELCAVLEADAFHTVAAGAFVGRHAFTDKLAAGRPNAEDQQQMRSFADRVAAKIAAMQDMPAPVQVPGDAAAPYYVPKGTDGQPAKFLKAKPKTDMEKCTNCGLCAEVCPVASIDAADVSAVPGICIKCHACVRKCPVQAKYFDDPAFLSHVAMLEQSFAESKQNAVFF